MRRSIVVIVLVLLMPAFTFSQTQTFRKDVTQIMGSGMSQDEARITAVLKAKRDAVEEAGTWLEAHTEVRNLNLAKDDVTALAAAVTQTRIIQEQPFLENGVFGIRVSAEVRVDTSGLAERVKQFLAERARSREQQAAAQNDNRVAARLETLERRLGEMEDRPVADSDTSLDAEQAYQEGVSLQLRDDVAAFQSFTRAIRLNPKLAAAFVARGDIYMRKAEPRLAVAEYSRAIAIEPEAAYVPYVYSKRADVLFETGEFTRAFDDYSKAIELEPIDAGHWYSRGSAHQKIRSWRAAIDDLSKAITLASGSNATYRDLALSSRADCYLELRDYAKAISDYSSAIQESPDKPYARRHHLESRGRVYARMAKYEEAIKDYNVSIQLDLQDKRESSTLLTQRGIPPDMKPATSTLLFRAASYRKLGKLELATRDIKDARAGTRDDFGYHANFAAALEDVGDFQAAISEYNELAKLAPDFVGTGFARGLVLIRMGRRPEGIRDIKVACDKGNVFACEWKRANAP